LPTQRTAETYGHGQSGEGKTAIFHRIHKGVSLFYN
jgi:hypothetical protein